MTTLALSLILAATHVAASPDDPRLVAATDGHSVHVTGDAGRTWRRVGRPGEVTALAACHDHVLWSSPSGLTAWDGRRVERRSAETFDALACDGAIVYGARDDLLFASEDGGRRFVWRRLLPDGTEAVAVRDRRIVVTTARGAFESRRGDPFRRLSGRGFVTLAPDGTPYRATRLGVDRHDPTLGWVPVSAVPARAVSIGAGDVWVVGARRVAPLSELDVVPRRRLWRRSHRWTVEAAARARRSAWLPDVAVVARTSDGRSHAGGALDARGRDHTVWIFLTWPLPEAAAHPSEVLR